MRASGGGGGGGTIVLDPEGLRRSASLLSEAASAYDGSASRLSGTAYPEMPPGVREQVVGAVSAAGSELAAVVPELLESARELQTRALWGDIADRLAAGYDLEDGQLAEFKAAMASGALLRYAEPWQAELARSYAEELQEDEEGSGGVMGFLEDVGGGIADFFEGAFDAVAEPVSMIYRLTPLHSDWTDQWRQLGEGLAYGVTHPVEFGKAIIGLDVLRERGFAYWLGNLAPTAAAAFFTGGAAAAARGASATARTARLVENADDLRRLGAASGRPGRIDYSRGLADDLANFRDNRAFLHEGPLGEELRLVQYFDKSSERASLKWWTSTDEANSMRTIDEVRERLALLPEWGERDAVRTARVPRGTEVEFLHGEAAEQRVAHGAAVRRRRRAVPLPRLRRAMATRDEGDPVTGGYAELAEGARAEAEALRDRWRAGGDADGARLAERLASLLAEARDAAGEGRLPPRDGGFPLTRFVSDYDWGDEGRDVVERVYALQRYWQEHA